jgi:hypothetical protein
MASFVDDDPSFGINQDTRLGGLLVGPAVKWTRAVVFSC